MLFMDVPRLTVPQEGRSDRAARSFFIKPF
jgi:hypothetical protein